MILRSCQHQNLNNSILAYMFKIQYKKQIRTIKLSQSDLIKNILSEVDKPGYQITEQDGNNVEFKYCIWRFGSKTESYYRVDGGKFQINLKAKEIVFYFYISLQLEVYVTIAIALLAYTQDYYIAVFIVFILIMFIVRIFIVKSVGYRMIENIVNL